MPPPSFATEAFAQQLSDLVKDSRLDTETLETCIQHVFYETGRTAHERHVCRTEQWVRQSFLGRGAYGTVHLENGEELDYARELEAIAKFSNRNNIMVVNKGPDWFVKIADFSISKRRQQDVTTYHTLQHGTLGFAAPEVFGFASDKKYTFSIDMWSLGAVAYRILTNSIPFPTIADLSAYVFQKKGFPTTMFESCQVSKTAQDFIATLMAPNPQDRLTATTAGQHVWLSGRPSSFIEQNVIRYRHHAL
ncbi:hypothetical protein PG994_014605 [Apiospora phragmitis]|uniref:Protein kinase domain-containing protein n=1 Tax=Apiospora phragmitis TaxID=2905665 RepID=A0ABR1T797_9PEZI